MMKVDVPAHWTRLEALFLLQALVRSEIEREIEKTRPLGLRPRRNIDYLAGG